MCLSETRLTKKTTENIGRFNYYYFFFFERKISKKKQSEPRRTLKPKTGHIVEAVRNKRPRWAGWARPDKPKIIDIRIVPEKNSTEKMPVEKKTLSRKTRRKN